MHLGEDCASVQRKTLWSLLNTSFLNDIEYVNRIKLILNQTKAEYVQDDTVNPNLLWEMVKMKVREESMKYGTSKKKKLTKKAEDIEQAIATLEKCLSEFKGDLTQRQKGVVAT